MPEGIKKVWRTRQFVINIPLLRLVIFKALKFQPPTKGCDVWKQQTILNPKTVFYCNTQAVLRAKKHNYVALKFMGKLQQARCGASYGLRKSSRRS